MEIYLEYLEGDIAPADCVVDENMNVIKKINVLLKLVWMKIKNSIDEVIDSITLQDMIDE